MEKFIRVIVLSAVCLFVFPVFNLKMQAVPAYPYPIVVTQPDGSEVTIYLKGDEFFNYRTTLDGYLLLSDNEGKLSYADFDADGNLVATDIQVNDIERRTKKEKKILKKLPQEADFEKTIVRQNALQRSATSLRRSSLMKAFPLQGTPKSLVLLVNFADKSFVTPNPKEAFTRMLNEAGYAENEGTGSARDYFRDNSMGVFSPQFDVFGPYDLPQNIEYYGRNVGDDDVNPQQMVIDACRLAHEDGVDFSEYDTDNDGKVDNIFIFYAGYNEAEGAPKNTIWPHRWDLGNYNTRFDSKIIFDYACTSELRSNTGSGMCGIGTFVHEFGHVLGLPDYYITAGRSNHHTLSEWNVMDYGSYLNKGRTPPAYSAFDRFYLDWLVPEELKESQSVALEPLPDSNKAYVFSETDNHNLLGNNPRPREFFTLENRQNTGWDTYLPGHGLLVTRINYNPTTWADNTVNNTSGSMGVDIVEADGKASDSNLSGDPFPGTNMVTYYKPKLRSGKELDKQLLNISEINSTIVFDFIGSGDLLVPEATEATNIKSDSFTANWQTVSNVDNYYLSVFHITGGTSEFTEEFDGGLTAPIAWEINAKNETDDVALIGKSAPAILLAEPDEYIQTERYILPVTGFSFHAKIFESTQVELQIDAWNKVEWKSIDRLILDENSQAKRDYVFVPDSNYVQFRIKYAESSAGVAIDDITVSFMERLSYVLKNRSVNANYAVVGNLIPDFEYNYTVRAARAIESTEKISESSNRITLRTEKISEVSNTINVRTKNNSNKELLLTYVSDGIITAFIPDSYSGKTLYIYNTSGQLLQKQDGPHYNFVEIKGLAKQQVYILKIEDMYAKTILGD